MKWSEPHYGISYHGKFGRGITYGSIENRGNFCEGVVYQCVLKEGANFTFKLHKKLFNDAETAKTWVENNIPAYPPREWTKEEQADILLLVEDHWVE